LWHAILCIVHWLAIEAQCATNVARRPQPSALTCSLYSSCVGAVCACCLCCCSFPMGFVSDRLYAGISRREFSDPSEPGCFYTVSKVVHTPTTAAWAALNYPGRACVWGRCQCVCSSWKGPIVYDLSCLGVVTVALNRWQHSVQDGSHAAAVYCLPCPPTPGVTMTDNYFSAWECRTILSPWASSEPEAQPACAIIL
jgi:hypothetical protein